MAESYRDWFFIAASHYRIGQQGKVSFGRGCAKIIRNICFSLFIAKKPRSSENHPPTVDCFIIYQLFDASNLLSYAMIVVQELGGIKWGKTGGRGNINVWRKLSERIIATHLSSFSVVVGNEGKWDIWKRGYLFVDFCEELSRVLCRCKKHLVSVEVVHPRISVGTSLLTGRE